MRHMQGQGGNNIILVHSKSWFTVSLMLQNSWHRTDGEIEREGERERERGGRERERERAGSKPCQWHVRRRGTPPGLQGRLFASTSR
jgi:hypothetical protein